jgi:hypothetical protein
MHPEWSQEHVQQEVARRLLDDAGSRDERDIVHRAEQFALHTLRERIRKQAE